VKSFALMLTCALVVAGCGPSQPTAPAVRQAAVGGAPASTAKSADRLQASRLQAPNAAFATEDGKAVTLQQFAGQAVVLNLWASWGTPCVREMPALNALVERAPETAVVTVSMDVQGPQPAFEFFKRKGLDHLDAYHDPDARLMRAPGVYGLPVSVLIDRKGRVAATIQGEVDWNAADIRALLAEVHAPSVRTEFLSPSNRFSVTYAGLENPASNITSKAMNEQ